MIFGDDIKLFVAGTLAILVIFITLFFNYINFHNGLDLDFLWPIRRHPCERKYHVAHQKKNLHIFIHEHPGLLAWWCP